MGNSKSSNPPYRTDRFDYRQRSSQPNRNSYFRDPRTINNFNSSYETRLNAPTSIMRQNKERLNITSQKNEPVTYAGLRNELLNTVPKSESFNIENAQQKNEGPVLLKPQSKFANLTNEVKNPYSIGSDFEVVSKDLLENKFSPTKHSEVSKIVSNEDDETNCPNCKLELTPQIFLCESGHSACQRCQRRLSHCQVCRQPFTTLRNTVLEEKLSKINPNVEFRTPCAHLVNGCNYISSLPQVEEHQDTCPHKVIKCPKDGCTSYVRLLDADNHLTNVHSFNSDKIVLNRDCTFSVNLLMPTQYAQILNFKGHRFIYSFRTDPNFKTVKWVVQKCGSSDWLYVLEIIDTSRPKRKILVTDVCRPVGDIRGWQGTILPASVIRTYLQNGRNLKIRLLVRMKTKK